MNEQNPIGPEYSLNGAIEVHSIFETIQGEGPFCGERALFIRLYGCNLKCAYCDTDYTSKRMVMTSIAVLQHAMELNWPYGALIVLTGGEPFRQNVVPLIHLLLTAGYQVQVETNGMIYPPDFNTLEHFKRFSLVCSPKTSRINSIIAEKATAFKYVLRNGYVADDGLPTQALGHAATPHVARPPEGKNVRIYIQPMDELDQSRNALNTDAAVRSCMAHGHTLQIQIHKIVGLP